MATGKVCGHGRIGGWRQGTSGAFTPRGDLTGSKPRVGLGWLDMYSSYLY